MDKAMARHSVRIAFYLSRSLTDYLEFMRCCTEESEFLALKIEVAEAIDKINAALINTSIFHFPELNEEIEDSLDKYGKYL